MEVVRDKADNCIIVCSIENIDPMGIHTGDSITVAPALTLTDKEFQIMRDASIAVLREIGVETGGSNVQFAVNPADGRLVIIEMNPRVSRSSALASKATGFPIAKVAAKLAVGYTLDELDNDITGGATPASFEPTIDYVVTKVPRFAFEKFPGAEPLLTTSMKSVGEVMAIGRTFAESPAEGAARPRNRSRRRRRGIDCGPRPGRRQERHPRRARAADAGPAAGLRPGHAPRHERRGDRRGLPHRSVVSQAVTGNRGIGKPGPRTRPARHRRTAQAPEGFGLLRRAAGGARRQDRGRRGGLARAARRPSELQAHRHLRGRVRLADGLSLFDLRSALRRPGRQRSRAQRPQEGHHPRRRPQPHRPGHRVRLLLLPCLLRARRRRLRIGDDQLQSGDGFDRLRHLRPALLRAADGGGRAGDRARRTVERHACRRHRPVRRADPAEARQGLARCQGADPRHLARHDRPCRGPRPVRPAAHQARPQAGQERHRLFGRAGAAGGRRTRPAAGGAALLRARRPGHADHPRRGTALQLPARHAARTGALRRQGALPERQDRADQHRARQEPAALRPLPVGRHRDRRRRHRRRQQVFIAGIMEHIEEAGIHSGDSACSLPPLFAVAGDHRRARARDRGACRWRSRCAA